MSALAEMFVGAIVGYFAGRMGHIIAGGYGGPHHYITGAVVALAGVALNSPLILGFGLGLAFSDLDDMLAGLTTSPSRADMSRHKNLFGTD